VAQQSDVINRFTDLIVGVYNGGHNKKKLFSDYKKWKLEFTKKDVFVCIDKKFYDLLQHGFIRMSDIDLLIFDEAHHTDQDHLYNMIMREFFYL